MRIRTSFLAFSLAAVGGCAHAAVTPAAAPDASATVELVVAATTDIHARVRGWNYDLDAPDPAVGLARAATIVDSLRDATDGRVILIDAGDIIQGNALGFVAAKVSPSDAVHPVMAAMNAMRYDAAVVGNHEFNYGVPFLERTASQAQFPLLAANTKRPDGSRPFRAWTASKVRAAGVIPSIRPAWARSAGRWAANLSFNSFDSPEIASRSRSAGTFKD